MKKWTLLIAALAVTTAAFAARARVSPVLDAAMRGDVTALKERLRSGGDVNAAQGDGFTALHWAAKLGNEEIARVLIAAGADVKATTRIGNHQPLHVAAAAGQTGVAEALLAGGAPVAAPTATGAQPIHYAAASGIGSTVHALVAAGANVDAVEPQWGQTPLMFAAAGGRTGSVNALLEEGADPSITARVLDVASRAEADLVARRARQQRIAAERGGAANVIFDPRERERRRREAAAKAAAEKAEREKGRTAPETADIEGSSGTSAEEAEKEEHARAHGHPEDELKKLEEEEKAKEDEDAKRRAEREARARDPQFLGYAELVGTHGGLTPLLLAARDGHRETALAMMEGGADINQRAEGHLTTPLMMASLNGHYDIGMDLLERGADPNLKNISGGAPLYAAINARWISQPFHPQPADHLRQSTSHLEFMEALLEAGAEVNARLYRKQWYSTYNTDQLGVDRAGATAFWRAAYALDIPAMKLLVKYGADPGIPTIKVAQRRYRGSLLEEEYDGKDPSGLPPAPFGGPGVYPIHAAAGVGYGLGLAANSHRHAPDAWLPAVKYLVEELGADVTARDHDGYGVIHHAASRGDNEMIRYLISRGADPLVIARTGQTTVDLANGPVQRISPFPETIALLESFGAKNNNRCVGC